MTPSKATAPCITSTILASSSVLSMPRPEVALPWGSKSIIKVRYLSLAR